MKVGASRIVLWVPSLLAVIAAGGLGQDVNVGISAGSGAASFQVLTTGPVHETFATPVVFEPTDAVYVPVDPPPVIVEVPPLERPAGYSEWIPGYWLYDDGRNGWTWVTGTWRIPPTGYTWVEGYWTRTPRGWRYVSGYWAVSTATEIEYLPAPPAPIDVVPIGVAPSADAIWVPGTWIWSGSGYAWRQGYWLPARNDWVWTPAEYVWTPSGYVFVDGYWDYPPLQRGLLYAPVAFNTGTVIPAGYSFSPSYVINLAAFSDGFFVQPLYHHYYFGDYYATTWWERGFYPAFSFHMSRYGYDPIFAYQSWRYGRGDPRWLEERRARFLTLRSNERLRPPRTLDEQAREPARTDDGATVAAAPIAIPAKDVGPQVTPLKLERAPETERQKVVARAKELERAREARMKLEAEAKPPDQPRKTKAPKELLPIAGAEAAKLAPPPPERPAPPKVEPGRQPERERPEAGRKPVEPSIENPADHRGRAVDLPRKPGEPGPPKREGDRPGQPGRDDGNRPPKPDERRPDDATPPPPAPRRPEGKPDDRTPPPKPADQPRGGDKRDRRPDEGQGQPKPPPPSRQPQPQPQPPPPKPRPDGKPGEKPEPRPDTRPKEE